MTNQKLQPNFATYSASTVNMPFRRRMLLATLGALSAGISACRPSEEDPNTFKISPMSEPNKQADFAYFDVTILSYLDYVIFDVYINKKDIGVANAFGGGGLITGIRIKLGEQNIEWRDAGTGRVFHASNHPILSPPLPNHRYLGVHIYPDNTVELIPEQFWPRTRTERGNTLYQKWRGKHEQ